MNVQILTHTPNPQQIVAAAAKLCYSTAGIDQLMAQDGSDQQAIITKVLDLGHFSVLEHASFSFGIEGISRACSHQLVRHRIASYSQQSQRYIKAETSNFGYDPDYQDQCVWPESILAASDAIKYKYRHALKVAHQDYTALINNGIPPEDARFVLPNAQITSLIMTMNARELHHFFTLRTCNRAQWEIRAMAKQMLHQCRQAAPLLFKNAGPSCLRGACPEAEMCCGKMEQVLEELKT